MSEGESSDSITKQVFHGFENENDPFAEPVHRPRFGIADVKKLFLGKAINAYFELKFKVGNPKYK